MLAGRTRVSGWLRGREAPAGRAKAAPQETPAARGEGRSSCPKAIRGRRARLKPPDGVPSASGAARKGRGPRGHTETPELPLRPQITEAADPPFGKLNHIPVSIKRSSCNRPCKGPMVAARPFPSRRPHPSSWLKKTFTPGLRQHPEPPQPCQRRMLERIDSAHPAATGRPGLPDAHPAWEASVPSRHAESPRSFRCAMTAPATVRGAGKACARRRRRLWLGRRQMPLPPGAGRDPAPGTRQIPPAPVRPHPEETP
ncbi:hypothetical protein EBL89_18790 [Cereibacter sphaeroides]|nr:hypothetical protein EBL89_18790 [Cereibacter sphaeroides]AZB61959.1 hypothetical protein EBL88_18875 [Cereibacter sphaeroides]